MATLDQIVAQLAAAGWPKLPDGHPVVNDVHHRYGPGKKFWYVLHEIARKDGSIGYTGAYGRWSGTDNGSQPFQWEGGQLSAEEVAEVAARQKRVEQSEAEKRQVAAKNATNRARRQWTDAKPDGQSEYLTRKQITAESIRFADDGTILVPLIRYDEDRRLVGVQKITPDGAKRFNKGMEKRAAACRLGEIGLDDRIALIGEGYATGRSVRMALDDKIPFFVCFDAGNLLLAGEAIRTRHPDVHLLFCADDDWMVEHRAREFLLDDFKYDGDLPAAGETIRIDSNNSWYDVQVHRKVDQFECAFVEVIVSNDRMPSRPRRFENAGLQKARSAAQALGNSSVVFPVFESRGERKLTDFNDLHCSDGLDAVRDQVQGAIFAALLPAQIHERDPVEPDLGAVDPLLVSAAEMVRKEGRASVSQVQREFRIGYNRAARLLEELERSGIVSAPRDNGVRFVLVKGDLSGEPAKVSSTPSPAGAAHPNEPGSDGENAAPSWQRLLKRAEKTNAILPCLDNVFSILTNDKDWDGLIAYEEFTCRVVKRSLPPFPGAELGEWMDADDARCALWLAQRYGVNPRRDILMDAVFLVADRNRYHVVREYFWGLVWDSKPRIGRWLVDYMKVEDTEYARLVGQKWMLGAVGRVMEPGVKMDNVMIIEGSQGIGKSRALRLLAGDEWFTDAPMTIGDKDTYVVMVGKLIIELAELDSFTKAESSASKRFFSTSTDNYRPPYGKRAIAVPRQGIFAGTVNFDTYLKDESGNRRYWPVKSIDKIDHQKLIEDRDQLWAEAFMLYREWTQASRAAVGHLPRPWEVLDTEIALFEGEQEARYEGDVYETMIRKHVELHTGKVTMQDILDTCLKLEISKWTPAEQRRVGKAMKVLGWERKRETTGSREWYYVRPEEKLVVSIRPSIAQSGVDDESPL